MAPSTLDRPDVLLTGPGRGVSVPRWASGFSPRTATAEQFDAIARLPALTIVQTKAPKAILKHETFLQRLAARHDKAPRPSMIVFVFDPTSHTAKAPELQQVLAFFHRTADVQFARGPDEAAFALDQAWAKIMLGQQKPAPKLSQPDPLGQVRSVLAATADLRTAAGRLSAQRVAAAFGLSVAELAALIGRKRQTISKTDDAESLQPALFPFERIARLRTVLPSADFRRWLNMPNSQLDGRPPLDVIRTGQVGVVADFADDMLTGSPV
jgi:Protein of unknown function (DUF2384)